MTITKDGKNYLISSSYKTVEDDFIIISMGYKAKEIFNKSEIAKLIVVLTTILYGENKYKQIRVQAVEEYKKALKTVLEEESCIHSIDLDIEASKVIDGF